MYILCKNNSVWKYVADQTLIRALRYGTVWVNEHSPFVVSVMANCKNKIK